MIADIALRPEKPADHRAVEHLTREAFWNVYKPGCDEHYLLHLLRGSSGYLPDLHLLAVKGADIVGNIVYSRAYVVDKRGDRTPVLCMGPIGVLRAFQRQGIGSLLIRRSLDLAREKGERAVILFGDPAFYHRFGFRNAKAYQITTADGQNLDPFMALPLYEGALDGVQGCFMEDKAFHSIDPDALKRFDAGFPLKVELKLPGQLQ